VRATRSASRAREICGLDHDRGLGVEFRLDFDLVAGHDTAGGLALAIS